MSKAIYQNWIKKGLEKGLSDIEIYAVDKTDLSIEVYDGKIEKNEISKMNTALIKGIYNGKAAKSKVENLNENNIDYMLDRLIDSASNITANEPALIFEGSKNYPKVEDKNFDFGTIDPLKKVNLLLEVEKGIYKEKTVTKVETVSYSESDSKTTIVNSKGLNLSRHHTYATVYAVGVYQKDEQIKTGMSYQIVKDFDKLDASKLINDNIKDGASQLGAHSIDSKAYPIVFSNEMFGNILGVFTSIFTGEAAFRKLTKLIGKENEEIASPIVNLIDDPLFEKALFKVPFDDEGVACEKRYWIKDGKFTGFAHNLKTAEIFKTKSTGNGFASGIEPGNLYLESQNITFDELIKPIESGIYITDLVGLHAGVETVSGDFSLQAAGFEIKNGKLDRPVDMIVVSGNYFKLLKDIEAVANDFIFGLSGIGTGSVKVKALTVAGK
ncbi:TldD/PmbA family protein [Haploplasma axanthum]|uniref:Peptidase PmbA n=1 Tax=Haploplasma axanthum TaxID=29552 RepID=A0A449BF27_HAPAX|nr:metallopeptidase TldD-related protein [Haploplasma axanthum]VEU81025.1 peptidase PmbA [Haploplasma axanthum]